MKIFIWKNLKQVSGNYHSGGGLVVVAKDYEAAKELITKDKYISLIKEQYDKEEEETKKVEQKPDVEFSIEGEVEETYYVFPDAGCC